VFDWLQRPGERWRWGPVVAAVVVGLAWVLSDGSLIAVLAALMCWVAALRALAWRRSLRVRRAQSQAAKPPRDMA
jgi:hypothetical protein